MAIISLNQKLVDLYHLDQDNPRARQLLDDTITPLIRDKVEGRSIDGCIDVSLPRGQSLQMQIDIVPYQSQEGDALYMVVMKDITQATIRDQMFHKLYNVSMTTELTLQEKATTILENMAEYLDAEMAYVTITNEEKSEHVMQAGPYAFPSLSDETHPAYQMIVQGLQNDSDVVQWDHGPFEDYEVQSFVGTTVFIDAAPSGHVGFASTMPRDKPLPESTIALIKLVAMWVGREITEKRNLTVLEQNNKALIDSNRELDDFSYIASHDLKAPVRGMANYAQFLIEDYNEHLDQEGQAMLTSLQDLAIRMDNLLSNLMYYSRLGRVDMALQLTNLNAIAENVRDTIMLEKGSSDEKVEITIKSDLPTLPCDHVRVEEVMRNLISNAIKYNDSEIKTLEIDHIPGSPANHFTPIITLKDNGIGIEAEHQDQVFKIFRRLHKPQQYGGGTGSGLTLVKKIIERHGGQIWLESEKGRGTTFFFTLNAPQHDI